jgi:drug/metabolite transporter (DMT)-like permease
MTPIIATTARANLIGSLWMILAMAGFAVEDMFLKSASVTLPIGEVLILFGLGGTLLFALIARARREVIFTPEALSRVMQVRIGFEIFGRLFYILALAFAPLSSATAILQATPVVVVAGAALFFGEPVGWRRWCAILVGLLGVLIILRPASASFTLFSRFAVLGMLGFAGRDLASRAAPPALSTAALGTYGFVSVIIAGAGFSLFEGIPFVVPTASAALAMLGAIVFGVLGYGGLMKAMRTGEVSSVTPFRYSRLIFGLGFGVFLFGETLDNMILFGCALVVASGLYILWRGKAVESAS